MTVFKDRLPGTLRIKKKFVPSAEKVRISRNRVIQCFYIIPGLILLALLYQWLEL